MLLGRATISACKADSRIDTQRQAILNLRMQRDRRLPLCSERPTRSG
jgi:hypothetical protein